MAEIRTFIAKYISKSIFLRILYGNKLHTGFHISSFTSSKSQRTEKPHHYIFTLTVLGRYLTLQISRKYRSWQRRVRKTNIVIDHRYDQQEKPSTREQPTDSSRNGLIGFFIYLIEHHSLIISRNSFWETGINDQFGFLGLPISTS